MFPKRKFSACRLVFAIFGICLTYFILRRDFLLSKAFSTVKDTSQGRHFILSENSVHKGDHMTVTKLLNGKSLIRNSTKHILLASPRSSLLKSAEDLSPDRQITTKNRSIHTNKNETKIEHGESSTNSLNIVTSTQLYPLFQPAEEEEFPTTDGQLPRIPHIIHQMYADEMIPEMHINYVKSFIKHNPAWEYRFWTDESGRRLLQKHHPYLVQVYDNFGSSVMRSDLLRYAVLYEYGGFYADLDLENLRSLNITTIKYACVISVEPFEHSAIINNMEFLMNNAVMSCRPKHPFFKLLLWDLRKADPKGYPVSTTGPGYVTMQFRRYMDFVGGSRNKTTDLKSDWTSSSPYFYKGDNLEDDNDSVYVPNSQYFMDNVDPALLRLDGAYPKPCESIKELPYLKQRGCSEFYRRKALRKHKTYTFTKHHWHHLWARKKSSVDRLNKIHIRDVVSNCILYYE